MAHFAKLSEDNKVLSVEVVSDEDTKNDNGVEEESIGIQFLTAIHGWPLWAKCSYNTRGGKHFNQDGTESSDQSKAFRKNFPGIGYTWDSNKDMFYAPQPFPSWTLDEISGEWKPPTPKSSMPPSENGYHWDEATTSWVENS